MDYVLTEHACGALAKRQIALDQYLFSATESCDSLLRPKEIKPMKLKVDHQADALYLSLSEETASESEEVSPGIIVDFNEKGQAVGIEMLHLSKRASSADFQRLLFESIPIAG